VSFDDFRDNRAIAERLRRSLEGGRLAHAYLFVGPRGSGKMAMATTLAQALNCSEAHHDACGRCKSCQDIEKGAHPDVHMVRPESKSRFILVSAIRELENALVLKPAVGRMKVAIVVDAERMNPAAQNAFLKTLEEPPARTLILLLTTEPQSLLPTILSRCLRVSFGAVRGGRTPEQQQVASWLAEFTSMRPRGVVHIYRLHAALTKLLGDMRKKIEENTEEVDPHGELTPEARGKLEEERIAQIEGEYRGQRELVLEELYTWFADVLLCVIGADTTLLAHPEHLADLQRAAVGLTYEQATAHLDAVEGIRDALTRNLTEAFALEVGLLKLIQ